MLTKRFFISWIVSSIVMYAAFYCWHGMFLNDFIRLSYPKEIFLVSAAIVYLVIGFAVNKVYESPYLDTFKKKFLLKGIVAGAACGLLMYLISIVVGVSFSTKLSLVNLLFDLSWQVVEQSLGGVAVFIVQFFVLPEKRFRPDHD